jgi:hypothetical protein
MSELSKIRTLSDVTCVIYTFITIFDKEESHIW